MLRRLAAGAPADASHPLDLSFVARDGTPRRARLRFSPLPGGGTVFVDGSGIDRVEVERAEPFESGLLQTVLDAIPTPIWFKTTDGLYRGCNLAFEHALGRTRDELIGRPVEATGPSRITSVYRDADRALFTSGGTQFYEGELSRADGEVRRVAFHKAAFRDHSGQVVGLAGALLDITDLRRTEEDLRKALLLARTAETRFTRLVESTPDLIVIHKEGRILFVNSALAALAGRAPAELAGTSILDLIHPDDRDRLAGRLRAAGPLPPMEGRLVGARGRQTPVEFISIDLEMEGDSVRVAIGRDLTERKQAEERLQQSDRLASLGTLAAGVAHELNNPLSFVLSNAEWSIVELSNGPLDEHGRGEVVRALRDVVQGAHRMRVIVGDLRAAARDESASDTLAAVDLRRVVELCTRLVSDELRQRGRLELSLEDVPPVFGSETRLSQVLVNLLVNAAHAIRDGDMGRNVVRVELREAPGGRVALTVTDSGCGIPASVRPHLFEPFFTTKPLGEGTGLGLWVCHGIVTAHGGEIEVESEPGRGTSFRVLFPALSRAGGAVSDDARRPAPAGPPARS